MTEKTYRLGLRAWGRLRREAVITILAFSVGQLGSMTIRNWERLATDPLSFFGVIGFAVLCYLVVVAIALIAVGKKFQTFALTVNGDSLIVPLVEGKTAIFGDDVERIEESKDYLELVRRKGFTRILIPKDIQDYTEVRELVGAWAPIKPKPRYQLLVDLAKSALFILAATPFFFKNLALECVGYVGLIGLFYWFRHEIFVDTGVPPESRRNLIVIAVAVLMLGLGLVMCGQLYDGLFIQPR